MYQMNEDLKKTHSGKIEKIGSAQASFGVTDSFSNEKNNYKVDASDFHKAVDVLINHLEKNINVHKLAAIGHRIVYGMAHSEPAKINEQLLKELKAFSSYDPDHLPAEVEIIEKLKIKFPQILQVACFDTSFHSAMPRLAKIFPLPRDLSVENVRRYGFHGLSYSYLMEELKNKKGAQVADGKIIITHLGSGASLAAVKNGKCVDTSMGFTPAGGIMMGTRCGDIDPGVAWYLLQNKKMNASQFNHLINHESGLLGVSGLSADMHDLLQQENSNAHAAEAIALFCYQAKKFIGAFIAVLGGLDALVFSGGIGENAFAIRRKICSDLKYTGIELDEEKNIKSAFHISTDKSRVKVFVIRTDEELMIARHTKNMYKSE